MALVATLHELFHHTMDVEKFGSTGMLGGRSGRFNAPPPLLPWHCRVFGHLGSEAFSKLRLEPNRTPRKQQSSRL